MIIKNAMVYTKGQSFQKGEIYMQDGVFSRQSADQATIDANGCYAIP